MQAGVPSGGICLSWTSRSPQRLLTAVQSVTDRVISPVRSASDAGVYVDSSALVKLYVPETESDTLDALLRGRRDLMISELAITEVLSAVARRRREGSLSDEQAYLIRDALLEDAASESFQRLELSPGTHREAERLLLSTHALPLRTLDALHVALALEADAKHILTFDMRMREAAVYAGLSALLI